MRCFMDRSRCFKKETIWGIYNGPVIGQILRTQKEEGQKWQNFADIVYGCHLGFFLQS